MAAMNLAKKFSKSQKTPCEVDLKDLKVTDSQIATAAQADVKSPGDFQNAVGSSVFRCSIFTDSPLPSVAGNASTETGTVGEYLSVSPGTVAQAQLGGPLIYVNAAFVSNNVYSNRAILLHELLHNITGQTDADLQKALGLSNTPISDNITQNLLHDCF